tara:strand:- start:1277 stop:2374 length:1098 start_codon:yes stop_codon:yes gene_type:complete
MPYIGKSSDGFGIRERYRYSATSNQTDFTSTDLDSKILQIDSGSLVDVYLNGVLLDTADYNTNTANQVTLTSGASASDEVMIVVYDVFSLSDAMPKTGGTFSGAVTHTGAFTSVGIDDNADTTTITIDSSEHVGIGTASPAQQLHLDESASNSHATIRLEGNNRGGKIEMYQGSTIVSNIEGDQSGNLYFGTSGAFGNSSVSTKLTLGTAGDVTISDGNLVIGTSGHGIDFSAVSNAGGMTSELLDSYETGTWTASLISGSGITFSSSERNYVKIGRVVYINISCNFSGTSSNRVEISGLPFASSDTSACTIFHSGGSLPSGASFLAQTHSGHNRLSGGKSATDMTYSDVNGTTMRITGCYLATA